MKISTRGRYALRIMIDLAERKGATYVPLRDIAERQEISEKYLESIVSLLVKANILIGLRGKGGGYRLADRPEAFTAGQILRLTEGSIAPVACLDTSASRCCRAAECKTLPLWLELERRINDYLDGVTIADLAQSEEDSDFYVI